MSPSAEALASPRSATEQNRQSQPSARPGAANASNTEPAAKLVGNNTHAERDARLEGSRPNGLTTSTRPATKPSAMYIAPVSLSIAHLPDDMRSLMTYAG